MTRYTLIDVDQYAGPQRARQFVATEGSQHRREVAGLAGHARHLLAIRGGQEPQGDPRTPIELAAAQVHALAQTRSESGAAPAAGAATSFYRPM